MVQFEQEQIKKYFGVAVFSWLFVGVLVLAFSLLSNYRNGLQFNGTVIFALIGGISMTVLIILTYTRHAEKLHGTSNIGMFWFEDPDKHVLWIPIAGFFGVIGASYLGSIINNPLAGIFGSGVVMLLALYYTRSVVIPFMIHGAFNVFVILGQAGYLGNSIVPLALNPSFSYSVPVIGTTISSIAPILSEILSQFFIVAPSEEILKILMIAGFIVIFRGSFSENTAIKWLAGLGSLLLWTELHSVQAI